ncbi:MAG: DNA polymerase III subunit epsilon [Burkholderiaceae bacterium]|jgi:DNA polymerase-3 subunit epsilon|nr:DNA polymerase III subunit epsilon [Burkholderiaceae bacterium]
MTAQGSQAARQIVLDTETTGLSAENGDRIIEIGCVELIGRRLTSNNKHYYLNPERKSEEEALRIHGISDEFLRDKPKFAEIAADLLDYLQGAELIIHNAPFDVGFLDKELERIGQTPIANHIAGVIDTLVMAKEAYPGKRNSLDALCERLAVDNSSRTLHGALLDAELLADVYINLTRGQEALLIDLGEVSQGAASDTPRINLTAFDLPVLRASAEEAAQHAAVLLELDKASGGKALWRKLEPHGSAT